MKTVKVIVTFTVEEGCDRNLPDALLEYAQDALLNDGESVTVELSDAL